MKADEFKDAMALYAEADQRATAKLIELVAATVLRLAKHPLGQEVVNVKITPDELAITDSQFYSDFDYDADGGVTIFVTPLILSDGQAANDTVELPQN